MEHVPDAHTTSARLPHTASDRRPSRARKTVAAVALTGLIVANACGVEHEGLGSIATNDNGTPMTLPILADTTTSELATTTSESIATSSTEAPTTTQALPDPFDVGRFSRQISLKITTDKPVSVRLVDARALAVSASGIIAVGTGDGLVFTFASDGTFLKSDDASLDTKAVADLEFIGQSNRLVAASRSGGRVTVWNDATTLATPMTSVPAQAAQLSSLASTADGRWLAIGGVDGQVAIVPVAAAGQFGTPSYAAIEDDWPVDLAFAEDPSSTHSTDVRSAATANVRPALVIGTAKGTVQLLEPSETEPFIVSGPLGKDLGGIAVADGGSAVVRGGAVDAVLLALNGGAGSRLTTGDVADQSGPIHDVASRQLPSSTVSRIATAEMEQGSGSANALVRLWGSDGSRAPMPATISGEVVDMEFFRDGSALVVIVNDSAQLLPINQSIAQG